MKSHREIQKEILTLFDFDPSFGERTIGVFVEGEVLTLSGRVYIFPEAYGKTKGRRRAPLNEPTINEGHAF